MAELDFTDDGKGIFQAIDDRDYSFAFHRVFREATRQVDVFEELGAPLVESVLSGENAAAIAYGMTGSGKTHTMLGPPRHGTGMADYSGPERGLAPRMMELLFGAIRELGDAFDVKAKVGFLELYQDAIFDLLHPERRKKVKIRLIDDAVWVPTTEVPCVSAADVMRQFDRGLRHRTTAKTGANETSSRSHAIMQVNLEIKNKATHTIQTSVLNLVDLAGSEAVAITEASGQRLEEAKRINSSLHTLAEVCKRLALPPSLRGVVPYRDSSLTSILRNSFGGNSRTVLLVNLSPAALHERDTLRTLQFGSNVAAIRNKPKIAKRIDYGELRRIHDALEADVATQELQLSQYRSMLKRLARAAANAVSMKKPSNAQLEELLTRFPVLKELMPGAVMTRFLHKGMILRMLSFAGGQAAANMMATSGSMFKVVSDDRLWRMFCHAEVPGFKDKHLALPKACTAQAARLLCYVELQRLKSSGTISAAEQTSLMEEFGLTPAHVVRGVDDVWEAAADGDSGDEGKGDEGATSAAEAAAAASGADARPPRGRGPSKPSNAKRTYRQHYLLVMNRVHKLRKRASLYAFETRVSQLRGGTGEGVRLVPQRKKA